MYTILIPAQSLLGRLRGVAAVAAFPVVAACSIWAGAVVVDQLQASRIHLAPPHVPQCLTRPDCPTAPGTMGAPRLQLPPWANLMSPSVKAPINRSP